ncbi:hypothetical protein, partial [Nonomuraea sp. NPDC050643]|uniref:hypothetical protein n=1 Tax=Nonomuraea sp. NPDC050643 TaxID=3155660 RepID=UPI0033D9F7A8
GGGGAGGGRDGAGGGEWLPEAVPAIVLGRLRGLGEQGRQVLRAAGVLGSAAFDPVLIAEMLGLPPQEVAGHCERALRRGLLVVSRGSYAFANDLTREALNATTPAPTRLVYQLRARCALLVSPCGTPSAQDVTPSR